MKKGTTNLLLVFASLFILVSISEFVLQKFYPIIILDTIFEKDDLLPYSLRKNSVGGLKTKEFNFHVSINSLGYRDEEFNLNQRKKRILVIGDSFTFGYGVNNDESYPALLNNLL